MHHNLDIHPIPEEVLYINDMDLLEPNYYELKEQIKKAASGKTIEQGGILPDDNVRIYVPMDLNADMQVRRTKNAIGQLDRLEEQILSLTRYLEVFEAAERLCG